MKRLILLCGGLLALASLAHAATYYVSAVGTGTGCVNGGQATNQMRNTITAGLDCVSPGDTLIVKDGTYVEVLPDIIPEGISDTQRTTLQSEVRYGAIIRPSGSQQGQLYGGAGVVAFNRAYITVDGFVIDMVNVTDSYGLYISNTASYINLFNNDIKNGISGNEPASGRVGIYIGQFTHHSIVRNNKIHDLFPDPVPGTLPADGMYVVGADNLIEGNEIWNIPSQGIQQWSATGDPSNNVYRNNVIHDIQSRAFLMSSGSNNLAYNNILWNYGYDGYPAISIGGYGVHTSNPQVYHNTIVGGPGRCLNAGSGYPGSTDGTIMRNNICWQTGNDGIDVSDATLVADHNLCSGTGTGCTVVGNPLFANAGANDYHLNQGSPAIAAGLGVGVTTDFDGVNRGSPPSIGAFEGAGVPGIIPVVGTFYFAPGGSATVDCDAAQVAGTPRDSIATIAPCAAPGSTLYASAGTYPQSLRTSTLGLTAGTTSAPITIATKPGDSPAVFKGTDIAIGILWLDRGAGEHDWIIDRIVFDGDSVNGMYGIYVSDNATRLTFRNVEIREILNGVGLALIGNSFVTVENSLIHTVGAPWWPVQIASGANVTVTGTTVHTGTQGGILVSGAGGSVLIEKALLRNNTGPGLTLTGTPSNVTLQNSLVYSNSTGVDIQTGATTAHLYYNTLWNNPTACIVAASGVTGSQVTNNICWASPTVTNNAGPGLTITTTQCSGATGCTTGDPQFANTTPGNAQFLHLGPLSPARDTGTPLPSVMSDLNGKARPDGPGVDRGAYEEVPVAPEPPAPRGGLPFATTHFLGP